ncbi:energy transducer TonB [Vineibacter terrae]|uniref:Energy transducer TonB n=1 Tax=Vineibacter terrae TaxID=2586908 RepID=A0A5C8PAR9_9HYPH|nr:energy transducer TonB [Vineibacter terrae]TXL70899.1 energy transducer TonB [Vineibacter terrae]
MVAHAEPQQLRQPVFGFVGKSSPTLQERLRWGSSLVAALAIHALAVVALLAVVRPTPQPPPNVIEVEVVEPPPAAPAADPPPAADLPPPPDKPADLRPVMPAPPPAQPEPVPQQQPQTDPAPPPPQAEPPPQPEAADAASPAPPLPFHDGGFAIPPGPMASTEPPAMPSPPTPPLADPLRPAPPPAPQAEATPEPAARLAPLVITADPRRDPRLPSYPADARSKGEQGDVLVEVVLDPTGALRDARVKTSSGHARLDTAALHSARALRFRPPRPPPGVVLRNAILVEIPFSYRLQ